MDSDSSETPIASRNTFKLASITIKKGQKTSRKVCDDIYARFGVDYIPRGDSFSLFVGNVTIYNDEKELFSSKFTPSELKIEEGDSMKLLIKQSEASSLTLGFSKAGNDIDVAHSIYNQMISMKKVKVNLPSGQCVKSIMKSPSSNSTNLCKKSVSFSNNICIII